MKTTMLLHEGWQLADTDASALPDAKALAQTDLHWQNAVVPGTVAQSLKISLNDTGAYDSRDWWYRSTFTIPTLAAGSVARLHFEGLATIAQIWLNGEPILNARNMFRKHDCDVTALLKKENSLLICFRALNAELTQRKPRPRWKTALIEQQNLRWFRTTLLGRIPAWSPPIQAVGPWKNIKLEISDCVESESISVQTRAKVQNQFVQAGINVSAKLRLIGNTTLKSATLHLGEKTFPLSVTIQNEHAMITGDAELSDILLWWPHTHGPQNLYDCRIELETSAGPVSLHSARVGFKEISLDRTHGKVQLKINGVPVFCRGACWTTNDMLSLTGDEAALKEKLARARECSLNMIRIGGTMTYESDAFYRLCDELGVLVWQDFMFANMDYPVVDPEFKTEIEREARYQLTRLQKHACIAVYCGGSEVQQQAAMMGFPRSEWSNAFFDQTLPELCQHFHGGIPYFPSSPCEGSLPFHVSTGITHYYGVGAYRRPISDVKHAAVKFTPECLGFSNVPEHKNTQGGVCDYPPHHPRWKERVPRDNGAGWDFEDIRDHYLGELFGVDPIALRSQNLERYLAVSRVVTGEVMKRTFAEWRKPESSCGGGLVWFFNDLWEGAGRGILENDGTPKPVWHDLNKAWAPQTVLITDEGLEGLNLHIVNDTAQTLSATLSLELYTHQHLRTAHAERSVEIGARNGATLNSDELLGYFTDLTNSYRFGPAKYDVVRATLRDSETNKIISEDFYFPQGLNLSSHDVGEVQFSAVMNEDGTVTLKLKSKYFLQNVCLSSKDFKPMENYFHLAPNEEKQITFSPNTPAASKTFKADLSALNLYQSITVRSTPAQDK